MPCQVVVAERVVAIADLASSGIGWWSATVGRRRRRAGRPASGRRAATPRPRAPRGEDRSHGERHQPRRRRPRRRRRPAACERGGRGDLGQAHRRGRWSWSRPGVVVDGAAGRRSAARWCVVPGTVDVVEVPPGAVPTARPRSMRPTPNSSSRPGAPRSWAVASSRSTAACGLRPVLRSTASAPPRGAPPSTCRPGRRSRSRWPADPVGRQDALRRAAGRAVVGVGLGLAAGRRHRPAGRAQQARSWRCCRTRARRRGWWR